MDSNEQAMNDISVNLFETIDLQWNKLKQSRNAVITIDLILQDLGHQTIPTITDEMRVNSFTGGREELDRKMLLYENALKVHPQIVDVLKKELMRTRIRIEWGWGFGFSPRQESVMLLKSRNFKHVIFGLCQINSEFLAIDCPYPSSEDDLFNSKRSFS